MGRLSPTPLGLAVAVVGIALLSTPAAADDNSSFGSCYGPSVDCMVMTKKACLEAEYWEDGTKGKGARGFHSSCK